MNKNALYIFGTVLAIVGFLTAVYIGTTGYSDVTLPAKDQKVSENDHVLWAGNAENILIEYADLQCPSCRAAHSYMKPIMTSSAEADITLRTKTTYVYRHYPLSRIHKNAENAAHFAEALAKQGKFEAALDELFTTQDSWAALEKPQDNFKAIATKIGANADQALKDMDTDAVKAKVLQDAASGDAAGVSGTPTFFLNGKRLDDYQNFDDLKKMILDAVSASASAQTSGN